MIGHFRPSPMSKGRGKGGIFSFHDICYSHPSICCSTANESISASQEEGLATREG